MAQRKLHDDTHLDGFAVGIIAALRDEGYAVRDIAANPLLTKPTGHAVSFHTVSSVVRRLDSEPAWRGERAEGSGRPRETTAAEDHALVASV